MDDFERRLCAKAQKLYTFKMIYVSQMNPKKFLCNTTFLVQLPYIVGHSL